MATRSKPAAPRAAAIKQSTGNGSVTLNTVSGQHADALILSWGSIFVAFLLQPLWVKIIPASATLICRLFGHDTAWAVRDHNGVKRATIVIAAHTLRNVKSQAIPGSQSVRIRPLAKAKVDIIVQAMLHVHNVDTGRTKNLRYITKDCTEWMVNEGLPISKSYTGGKDAWSYKISGSLKGNALLMLNALNAAELPFADFAVKDEDANKASSRLIRKAKATAAAGGTTKTINKSLVKTGQVAEVAAAVKDALDTNQFKENVTDAKGVKSTVINRQARTAKAQAMAAEAQAAMTPGFVNQASLLAQGVHLLSLMTFETVREYFPMVESRLAEVEAAVVESV